MFNVTVVGGAEYQGLTLGEAALAPVPQARPLPPVVVHPTHKAHGPGNPTGQVVYTVLGLPLCSVLRWLGSKGVTPSQARRVCTMAGVNPSKHTITTQLQHGRHGRHGLPELSEEQQDQLATWLG